MTSTELTKLSADTLNALRGLKAAAETFRQNPSDSSRDDRLTAWLCEAGSVESRWIEALEPRKRKG